MTMNARTLLVAYALVNAALYSVLLPLWEGFDEPFHFAYIQQLGNWQGLPDPRTDRFKARCRAMRIAVFHCPQVPRRAAEFGDECIADVG